MSDAATCYDLLDVSRDASTEEIRAAWKTRIADLEPGDRRFDALNRAAKVLVDPEARAAYDAEHHEAGNASGRTPSWFLAGLAIMAAGLIAATLWMWTVRDDAGGDSAARDAQVAAERAVVPVLSYDYKHLATDQKAAQALMTGTFREDYDQLFTVLEENAPQTRTTVTASVIASGIVRATDDRVQVLVFVDRPTTNKLSADPVVYKDQVTVSMQLVDGEWLVDDLVTSPVQG